jgi:hypothetical protein
MLVFDIYNFDLKDGRSTDKQSDQSVGVITEDEDNYLCLPCRSVVTRRKDETSIGEAHEYTFMNPAGIVFHIGCFKRAAGCLAAGRPTDDNTWFSGYLWNYALCANCLAHLGWAYSSHAGGHFFGLILDQLIRP